MSFAVGVANNCGTVDYGRRGVGAKEVNQPGVVSDIDEYLGLAARCADRPP